MADPLTPKKARNDPINDLVRSLRDRYGLGLPIRDAPWSPSKIEAPERVEEQILRRIRYLHFQDSRALREAIKAFDDYYVYLGSDWNFKPLAELDVLPARPHSESALRRNAPAQLYDSAQTCAVDLAETLLRLLNEAYDTVKPKASDFLGAKSFQSNIVGENDASLRTESSLEMNSIPLGKRSPKRQSLIASFFKPAEKHLLEADRPTSKGGPFPDGLAPDPKVFNFDTQDGSKAPTANVTPRMNNPDYASAEPSIRRSGPDSALTSIPQPSSSPRDWDLNIREIEELQDHEMTDSFFEQKIDSVRLPPPPSPVPSTPRSKRSLPETATLSLARKKLRESPTHLSPRTYNVHGLTPLSPDMARSFESLPSAATSFVSNTTAQTSFNSSFSPHTSFTSLPSISAPTDERPMSLTNLGSHRSEYKDFQRSLDSTADHEMDARDGFPSSDKPESSSLSSRHLEHASKPRNLKQTEDYLQENLIANSPFDAYTPNTSPKVSLRQAYEVMRVALHCNLSAVQVASCLQRLINKYDELWASLGSKVRRCGKIMPERSSAKAWERAGQTFDGVALSASLTYAEQPGPRLFEFRLQPLKIEPTYRLARQFGSDRFCIIGMPGLSATDVPQRFRSHHAILRTSIINWLVGKDHSFLGRTWRAFYVKPRATAKTERGVRTNFNDIKYRVFFFAVDGHDLRDQAAIGRQAPLAVKDLLDWFMPPKENKEQPCLKFFARLALGLYINQLKGNELIVIVAVSSTVPTKAFRPQQIIRSDDAIAIYPSTRRLNFRRSDEKKRGGKQKIRAQLDATVMNDGCARISKAAMLNIADELGVRGNPPCVLQGRIGGAKGVWMVDASNEKVSGKEDCWIEITDKQLKFEGHPLDGLYPETNRVTFEVHSTAHSLSPAKLNFQLIPILVNQGVDPEVLKRLLKEDLTDKVGKLEVAMDSPLALRRWNQENDNVSMARAIHSGVEYSAGLPKSDGEKINWFLEHGFEPKNCRFLRDLCYRSVAGYCERLESKMNIELGRSTYALMIADPLAILEENEVHFGFSSSFTDPKSGFQDTMLHDVEVLVARSPAHLPSDIQKVQAKFKPELSVYKDVIVFSSKGALSLAEKLSGGDYDGDRAWVCWEPEIVDQFHNEAVPHKPGMEHYGIVKDNLKVGDILADPDFHAKFLRHGFEFNMEPGMLGICTQYHESLCYGGRLLSDPVATNIAFLLGHMVDRAKGGLIFGEETWKTYLKSQGLPERLPRPAYRDKKQQPKKDVIDVLVFEIAKGVRQEALMNFSKHFDAVPFWDEDLVHPYREEQEEAVQDQELKQVLEDLVRQIQPIHDFWKANCGKEEENRQARRLMSFKDCAQQCRDQFLAIEPLDSSHTVVRRWKKAAGAGPKSHWLLLKASALFSHYYRGNFVWHIAGLELGEIKASRTGVYHTMIPELYVAYKLDPKYLAKLERHHLKDLEDYGKEEEEDTWYDMVDAFAKIDVNE